MSERRRPERRRREWSDLAAANAWYAEQCRLRGLPREEALEWWENLTPTARIRRHRSWLKAQQEAGANADDSFNRLCRDVAAARGVDGDITRIVRGEEQEL